MKQLLTVLSFSILCSTALLSQSGSKWLFDDSTLPEVRITIDSNYLDEILDDENQQSDHEFHAMFSITKNGVTETVDSVGFRLRGNTSRASEKKSFKVSFDTFIDGREYRGLDKMNLNGEHNDPTIMRAKLSWDIFEKMGVKAPRSNHVSLFINDVFYGLYLNVEHIDNEFLKKEFDGDSGNLYKCLYPADLSYRGPNSDDYSGYEEYGRRPYDLKTNETENDYSGLASFIEFLNNSSDQVFEEQIHDYLDVDATLRWMAIDVLTGNWDNYRYNKNNFYLYNDPVKNSFTVIPYDYDNTLGIDFINRDWATRNLYTWDRTGEPRPLTKRLLEVQKFKDWYSYYLNETIETVFNQDSLFPVIDRLKAMVQTSAESDTFRAKDWPALDFEDYDKSFTQALGGHVPYGLKPFITQRTNSALSQLELNNIYPIIHTSSSKLLTDNGSKTIVVEAEVNDDDLNVVSAKLDILEFLNPFELKDDGDGFDETAGDGIFTGAKDIGTYSNDVNFFVLAQDQEGKSSRYPQNPAKNLVQENSDVTAELVINELMASNSSTIQDESGSYPDWVEIYNTTDTEISMSGYFLTDDLSNPDKWAFPDTTIPGKGFLLIWTDDDEKEGPMHASFNLSKAGEDAGLYKQNGSDFEAVNTLTFGAQTTDVSYGRDKDGSTEFVFIDNPTPGESNGMPVSNEELGSTPKTVQLYQNYPNPFNPSTTISFELDKQDKVKLEIFNITGQLVETIQNEVVSAGKHSVKFRADNLSSGVYFYRLRTSASTQTKKFTLIK
jgi:spore coat protein H